MPVLPARILFVDDDLDTREAMLRLLRNEGYPVRAAGTCQGALRCLDAEPIDLLITDYLLPDGDGLTILTHARQLYPVEGILVSGVCEGDPSEPGCIAGIAAEHFAVRLTKPIEYARLRRVVEELLEPQRRAALCSASVEAARSALRVRTLRDRIKGMAAEELDALARALRRHGQDLKEEVQVIHDAVRDQHLSHRGRHGRPG